MIRTSALTCAFAFVATSTGVRAQLVNKAENWGATIGLDASTALYDPTHHEDGPRQPYDFKTRAWGIEVNGGALFLRHYMFGGSIGVAYFRGDTAWLDAVTERHYTVQTINSIVGSAYVGWISSPLGRSPRMGRKWWFGAMIGRDRWSGERRVDVTPISVAPPPPLHMHAGTYVEPFVMFGGGDRRSGGGGFRLAVREMVQPDARIREVVTLGMFFAFTRLD